MNDLEKYILGNVFTFAARGESFDYTAEEIILAAKISRIETTFMIESDEERSVINKALATLVMTGFVRVSKQDDEYHVELIEAELTRLVNE